MNGEVSYRVTVGSYTFDVTLEADGGGLLARTGDTASAVTWHRRASHAGTLRVDEASTEVLLAATANATWVAIDGYQTEVQVVEARALRLAASLPQRAAQTTRVEVRAPMPGRVVAVRVQIGERVERNTLLAILEAMKMENELRASHAGRVADGRVAEGETVEHGALLILLEPPDE